jgi:hypothetical protein
VKGKKCFCSLFIFILAEQNGGAEEHDPAIPGYISRTMATAED